jgi:predicted ATPase
VLVLDNPEQVRAAGDIAELPVRRGRVLATSRAPLRVSGEQEYPVPGLPVPVDLDQLGPIELERLTAAQRRRNPEALAAFEGIRLFVTRGNAVRPGFALTIGNTKDVAAIVAHLEGVPLAIELAAARLRFLTPSAIHERLERP